MAFVTPNATNNAAPTTGNKAERTPKTTQAYVNFYLPLKDGTRIKLFSDLTLRLYAERAGEAKLVDLIKSGKITAEQIQKLIQVEISLARDENAEIEFDFGDDLSNGI